MTLGQGKPKGAEQKALPALPQANKVKLSPNNRKSPSVEAIRGKWQRRGKYDSRLKSFPLLSTYKALT